MPRRSPARFLAPLALLTAILTVFLVARSELGSSPESSSKASRTTSTSADGAKDGAAPAARRKTRKGAKAKTYTVKPGDVLGSISESTGVAVADLLDYNDLEDAQSLSVGQKLKLTE